jgi:hypothetical protein
MTAYEFADIVARLAALVVFVWAVRMVGLAVSQACDRICNSLSKLQIEQAFHGDSLKAIKESLQQRHEK